MSEIRNEINTGEINSSIMEALEELRSLEDSEEYENYESNEFKDFASLLRWEDPNEKNLELNKKIKNNESDSLAEYLSFMNSLVYSRMTDKADNNLTLKENTKVPSEKREINFASFDPEVNFDKKNMEVSVTLGTNQNGMQDESVRIKYNQSDNSVSVNFIVSQESENKFRQSTNALERRLAQKNVKLKDVKVESLSAGNFSEKRHR